MDKKENQRVRLTKQLLKNSLLELSKAKPLNKISISELCQQAGINRSTFYVHYGSQYDVLSDMEDDLIAGLEDALHKAQLKKTLTIGEQIEALCKYLKENENVAKFIFTYNDSGSAFAHKLFHVRFDELPANTLQNYQDEEKALITTLFINGIYHVIRRWLTEDFQMSPKSLGKLGEDVTKFF